jgi:hypothetical protein
MTGLLACSCLRLIRVSLISRLLPFVAMLVRSSSLHHLYIRFSLYNNTMGDEGARAMCAALQKNTTLTTL